MNKNGKYGLSQNDWVSETKEFADYSSLMNLI